MKIINIVMAALVLSSVIALAGCENTARGMHQDWRSGTQGVANTINNN